ncbi:uncharacterized protein LOC110027826 [Phalaenopsis equestris]|uniref:uncharacterized protein LOC110027826 n=1 Tax=Phalaenopsis equestris TaxID=78828 RepID=UPI0009E38C0A|nr:uncharacterized protein LOC110027826 [Phalaenopsis equestris]
MITDESLPMAAPLNIAAALIFIFATLFAFLIDRWRRRRHDPSAESPSLELKTAGEMPLLRPPLSSVGGEEGEKQRVEDGRRKKRGRKKRTETRLEGGEDAVVCRTSELGGRDSPYPFSSYSSATQRKIKMKYDELVKSNQEKELTMAQVGQCVNCLVDARNELQHKFEIIQRSLKIKKALLFKADKSSFDRLCQQVYKLEAEHRRLVEDAAVYNLLQEQIRLSPAYKTILEVGASMEPKDPVEEATEFSDTSFEELLAREKKDSFWHKNGKLRAATN